MNILSIQSQVAYGHVGNAAAMFALQRLGCDVWPVHTVQFSNHPGYGRWRGAVFDAGMVRDIIEGVAERGVFPQCAGVLSGYLGSRGVGEVILDTVAAVKSSNPAARYCCDPVIGDVGRGVYVNAEIPSFIRERILPAADILTPNQFELELLSDMSTTTISATLAAINSLHRFGPRIVLVTSLYTDETPDDGIDVVASDGQGRFRVRTPKLPIAINGAGDAIAAIFFFHYLHTQSIVEALGRAVSSIFGILHRTAEAGSRELRLIEAQDEFVNPSRWFKPEKL